MELMFANAWLLYLLWLVPLMLAALIAALRRREKRISSFVAPVMQKRLRPKSDLTRQTWQSILLSAGLLLCMIALARPQWGKTEQQVFRKGRDIVIALDVSRSMLANDVHPNRLQRAKIDIMDLLNEIEGDRTALLAFRHKAVALCPLTTDYAFLRHILDMAGLHSAPLGETDIGSAIEQSVEMLLEDDESSHKAVLLISDGEDLEGSAIDAAKKAAARNIPIFTVGFGRASGSTIPDSESGALLKYEGKDVISKLNNEVLYEIAKVTGGAYIPIQTASTAQMTLGNIYRDHFAKIAAREIEETLTSSYSERFHYFLLPGILFLIAASFMSKGRLAGSDKKKSSDLKDIGPSEMNLKSIALIVIILLPAMCLAQTNAIPDQAQDLPDGRSAARKAQRLHSQGKYDEAAELYLRAARTITGSAREAFTYNAAVSLYKAGKYSEAIDLLSTVSGEGSIPRDQLDMALGKAHFNSAENAAETNKVKRLANIANSLQSSAEHFAEAARLNTSLQDEAIGNTGTILKRLPSAKENAREAELLETHSEAEAFALLDQMLKEQRNIMKEAATAYTTDDPSQIKLLEDLAKRQDVNADLWVPLKNKLGQAAQNATNTSSIAALESMADELEEQMRRSALNMKDLDTSGYHGAAVSEDGVYRIWKQAAPISNLLTEDILRQSNSLSSAESTQIAKKDQEEGIYLTTLFKRRFEETFPENAPQQQQGDNAEEQMTPEKRAQILDLADLTVKTQKKALEHLQNGEEEAAKARQRAAIANLEEIQTLLPKQKQNDNQQQNQQQNQDQQQDNQNNDDQQEEPKEDPQKQPQQNNQEDPQQQDPEEQPEDPQDSEDNEMSESEVQRLLDKALQREKQHEIEKRKKHEYVPPKMIDRDW